MGNGSPAASPLSPLTAQMAKGASAVVPLVVAAGIAYYLYLAIPIRGWPKGALYPTLFSLAVILLLYCVYILLTGEWSLALLYRGKDRRPSTSKFQALIWTLAVVFAYIGTFVVRANGGDLSPIDEIPNDLMLAMGFSFATVAAAKGITVSYVNSGRIEKTAPAAGESVSVAKEDDGEIDLTKVQMLWWTFIAVGIYLYRTIANFDLGITELPDIGGPLMVLTGLSQGVYIGKKLATADTPVLTQIAPRSGPPGIPITVTGTSLGAAQGVLTLDGVAITPASWKESEIIFEVPKSTWTSGQKILVDVIANGRSGAAPLPFIVVLPEIKSVAKSESKLTISGIGFGTTAIADTSRSVTVGGKAATTDTWTDQLIVANIPASTGSSAKVIVTVGSATAEKDMP